MTLLVASLSAHSTHELQTGVRSALDAGADLVELRLDGLTQGCEEVPGLVKQLPPYRWIATCRPTSEGGHYDGSLADRVALLLAVGSSAPGFIDFEWLDWQRSANIRQKLELATAIRPGDPDHPHLQQAGGRLILSRHFDRRPEAPLHEARRMAEADFRGPMKIVWPAVDLRDNFVAFEVVRQMQRPVIALCTGDSGLLSRVLAKKFGAFASYAAADIARPTAAGQVGVAEMMGTYRWPAINASTRWFGVIGYPVRQSLGKHVHNALFAQQGVNAVYVPLPIDPSQASVDDFLAEVERLKELDFGGGSVTIPHKEDVRRWLGPRVDSLAGLIGAVNTLHWRDGRLHGTNTDYGGFVDSLLEHLDPDAIKNPLPYGRGSDSNPKSEVRNWKSEIENRKREIMRGLPIDVLGAGGAARAVVCALTELGADVSVFNRTGSKAEALAREFGCRHQAWEFRNASHAPVLINTTSLGMGDPSSSCPVDTKRLAHRPLVMDLVFKPLDTPLLIGARSAGCATINGLAMYAHQAARQFTLWTGQTVTFNDILSQVGSGSNLIS